MGLFRKLFGGSTGVDAMRLDILMEYFLRPGNGCAALQWTNPMGVYTVREHEGTEPTKAILVALLYGRILCVHKETRKELFARVGDLAMQNVRSEGATGFEFTPWVLHVGLGGGEHTLWPWEIGTPDQLTKPTSKPKTYSARLKHGQATKRAALGRWIHLDMTMGLERILAPSSALIAIAGFSRACDQETRYFLALLLWQMNAYWGSPDRMSFCSEALAYSAADSAIRSNQLQML